MFEYLIFSGGGVKIGMILGAYTYLYKHNFVNRPKVIMGTSSGSLLGLCICLGYDIDKINDYFTTSINPTENTSTNFVTETENGWKLFIMSMLKEDLMLVEVPILLSLIFLPYKKLLISQ